ncbi:MAG: AraC family transcriptional regulator [Spirochaetales bacterium]|nr:AraC family transcriptional regulator [Spirochaetales bacterium]
MKWIERLTDCVDYIEENLCGEIDMDVLCDKACLSRLYFTRLFDAVTGVSLSEYIRRRRMTLAVKDLISGEKKVIDVAYDYGYSSPEAFSRAFKSVHAISPSQVKGKANQLKSYHKIGFSISIKGDIEMNYRIEEKDAFRVLGTSLTTTTEDNRNFEEIPRFWQEIVAAGVTKELGNYSSDFGKMFGICFDEQPDKTFTYSVSVPFKGQDKGRFEEREIPAGKWAIFECKGPMPRALQDTWHRIFAEWLPATGHELAKLPQVEYYIPKDEKMREYWAEVWLPIL